MLYQALPEWRGKRPSLAYWAEDDVFRTSRIGEREARGAGEYEKVYTEKKSYFYTGLLFSFGLNEADD